MKQLFIILLLAVSVSGCETKKDNIVTGKYYYNFWDKKMPEGLCRFWVNGKEFQDSCHFYRLGDTIR